MRDSGVNASPFIISPLYDGSVTPLIVSSGSDLGLAN